MAQAVEQALRGRVPRVSFRSPPAGVARTIRDAYEMLPSPAALALTHVYETAALPLSSVTRTRVESWRAIAQSAYLWWPTETLCLFCERPTLRATDDGFRPHREDGPALEFRDGWRVYAWHGMNVPPDVIEQPAAITPERIDAERNVELRRVLLERYGEERFLEEAGAEVVDTDSCGVLYQKRIAGAEPIVMVRVQNSTPEPDGTLKIYRLRVPPWIRTARGAIAWTFGMPETAYAPEVET